MGNKQSSKSGTDVSFKRTSKYAALEANDAIGQKLKGVPILARFSDEERAKLGGAGEMKTFADGEDILKQGDPGSGFFIIVNGEVCVHRMDREVDQEIAILKAGDYFGEGALVNNQARGASVTSVGESVCFSLHRKAFFSLFRSENLTVQFAKRQAVSAEARTRTGTVAGPRAPDGAVTTKDADLIKLINTATSDNVLFASLSDEHRNGIVNSMYQEKVAAGTEVIKQGDVGDLFYVIETGNMEILVNNVSVATRGAGTSFGELALMYNAPRAATVKATEDSVLWVVHRQTFRFIVAESARLAHAKHMAFLKSVELLAPLATYERERVAEALEEVTYPPDTVIFKQGDKGDRMYIVQKGETVVVKDGEEVLRCKVGDYFGERALLKKDVRAATVSTGSEACTCIYLDRQAFGMLLGPLEEIMQAKMVSYGGTPPAKELPTAGATTAVGEGSEKIPFDRLEVVGVLGKGSFGYVQLVRDPATDQTYALKAVNKQMIVETGQKGHIMSEKNTMATLNHPFCVKLHQTFKDKNRLYLLLEPVLGGELFTILRTYSLFDDDTARFYAAGVVSAFEYMHSLDIVYRDLKPENLLVDSTGYLKITDFGFAKKLTGSQTYTLCGTPDYLAPEIVTGKGHGKGVDWWTVGVLIYEMLASFPPFYDEDPMRTYGKILHGDMAYPSHFANAAKSIIKKLLRNKPTMRLGVVKGGAQRIKDHAWFDGFSWEALLKREIVPSIIPDIAGETDLSNFEDVEEDEEVPEYQDDGSNWDADF